MADKLASQNQVCAAAIWSTPAEPFFRFFAIDRPGVGRWRREFAYPAKGDRLGRLRARGGCTERYPRRHAVTRRERDAGGYDLGAANCP